MRRGAVAPLVAAVVLLLSGAGPGPVAAATFAISTPYPAVTVQAGSTVTFALTVTTPAPERVDLAVGGTPSGWTANITGGGNTIDAVFTGGSPAPAAELSVKIPADAPATTTSLTVTATASEGTRTLPISIRVQGGTGGIKLTTDFAKLSGTATTTFTYTLTLENGSPQQQTFALQGQGPDGWQVSVHPSGNTNAVTDTVAGGATDTLNVSATPPSNVQAGAYPLQVTASAGGQSEQVQLEADVTGSPTLSLSTPNQVLNTEVTSGGTGTVALVVTNTGSVPLQGITFSSTPPSGWKVTFSPTTVASLDPNATADVTATIQPASNALAGDYSVTMTATSGGASNNVDIRTTVQTSPLWGFVGLGLIAVVFVGLGWVFRRYGRR